MLPRLPAETATDGLKAPIVGSKSISKASSESRSLELLLATGDLTYHELVLTYPLAPPRSFCRHESLFVCRHRSLMRSLFEQTYKVLWQKTVQLRVNISHTELGFNDLPSSSLVMISVPNSRWESSNFTMSSVLEASMLRLVPIHCCIRHCIILLQGKGFQILQVCDRAESQIWRKG